ncbi:MAG: tetratricopeptide repeat protein [Gammaproteobacteria bacterium]|nr:tetratricopeptide repeat protein [Gammaproteobacteria bacterium]
MIESTNRHRATATLGWFCMVVAACLTLWAYSPALDAGFVFDDEANITDSPAVHWTEVSLRNVELLLGSSRLRQRPVANLSFALDHLAGGLDPSGFHLTNVLIHLTVGGTLMWLCLLYTRLTASPPQARQSRGAARYLALVPVGLFLLHPLNTQAVAYVVQRMTSMAALFTLLAFASYLMARYKVTLRSRGWYVGAIIFWMLGIGSKENAVLLLPVIALYEVCFFRSEWQRRVEQILGGQWNSQWTVRAWAAAAVLVALASWVVMTSHDGIGLFGTFKGRDFSGLERMLTQTRVQLLYLSLLLWPSPARLSLDHDFVVSHGLLDPATTLLATFACLVLVASAIFLCVRRPRYGFPVLAYMLFHAIEAGPVGLELVFEHRMYLPSTMLVLLGSALLVDARPGKQTLALATIFVLSFPLTHWTYDRNLVWADPVELQGDIARKSPSKARAQHNFALALREAGRIEEALTTVQRAIQLDPGDDRPHRLLGDILLDLDRPREALQAFQTARTVKPTSMAPVLGIGKALAADGREEEAFQHYLATGTQFGQGGLPWQAIPVLREAVNLRAENAEARHALGSSYLMVDKHDDAIEQFRAALLLDSSKYESWYNLGLTADSLGLHDEAIRAYEGFIKRAPPALQQQISRASARIGALSIDTSR